MVTGKGFKHVRVSLYPTPDHTITNSQSYGGWRNGVKLSGHPLQHYPKEQISKDKRKDKEKTQKRQRKDKENEKTDQEAPERVPAEARDVVVLVGVHGFGRRALQVEHHRDRVPRHR